MIRIVYGKNFLRSAEKLSRSQQDKLAHLLELLQENSFHPALHTKPLTGALSGFYSFRITREWRVIFQFVSSDVLQLIEVGNRKDIYR